MFVNTRITICGLLVGASAALSVPALTASAAPAPTATASVSAQTYTVARGDTLSKIAKRFHTTVGRLVDLNKGRYPSLARNSHMIRVGWVLKIDGAPSNPPAPPAPKPTPAPGGTTTGPTAPVGTTYTVVRGDSLSKIAKRFHTTVKHLVDLNKGRYPSLAKNSHMIRVGWLLTVG
jgi:LysM repeat protein